MDSLNKFWPSRAVAAGLAVVFLFTNVLAAHAKERNFWAARRAALKREGLSRGELLLAQLPLIQADKIQGGASPATDFGVPPSGMKNQVLEDDFRRILLPYADLREAHFSKKKDAPLVIHIQDAHGILEAQRNIAGALGQLIGRAPLVGVEGAVGAFDLAPFRNYPDPGITRDISDFFLEKGLIAGPEYAGLTLDSPPALYGVEDEKLYLANLSALKASARNRESMIALLTGWTASVQIAKARIYSPELLAFDKLTADYRAGREKLADHVRSLAKANGPRTSADFPNTGLLLKALEREEQLDFPSVEAERRALVEGLVARLSEPELAVLTRQSLEYRSGRLEYTAYQRALDSACRRHGLRPAPLLADYMEYLALAEKIDRAVLIEELDLLERSAETRLAKTEDQKNLATLARDLTLLARLIRHEMTASDWALYRSRRGAILRLEDRLSDLSLVPAVSPPLTALSESALAPFEQFCSAAVARDTALAANLLAEMESRGARAAVLVAGGFHTEGLTALLRDRDVSCLVLTPKISKTPDHSDYLDLLAKDPVPLEKMLAGDKIFLSQPLNFSSTPLLSRTSEKIQRFFVDLQRLFNGMINSIPVGAFKAYACSSPRGTHPLRAQRGGWGSNHQFHQSIGRQAIDLESTASEAWNVDGVAGPENGQARLRNVLSRWNRVVAQLTMEMNENLAPQDLLPSLHRALCYFSKDYALAAEKNRVGTGKDVNPARLMAFWTTHLLKNGYVDPLYRR